jgi:hypothetical protein
MMCAAVGLGLALAGAVRADWDVGDPFKMHWPQLPDPIGWDVAFWWQEDWTPDQMRMSNGLADDWQCTRTGPVKDVHFWVSMRGDFEPTSPTMPLPFQITAINLQFYKDNPAGATGPPFSTPGDLIQAYDLTSGFNVRWWDAGPQGWYNPGTGEHVPPNGAPPDHINIYQVNIPNIPEPIVQEEGNIYWLMLDVWATDLTTGEPAQLGWKTTLETLHFQDDAVYGIWDQVEDEFGNKFWQFAGYNELILPPDIGVSRDFAFVITPEPATLALMGLGLGGLVLRRVRRKR